ncbi:MAG: hypothetical protein ABIJ91_00005 [Candidatus Kuenenbacteria bacterium]
MLFPFLQTNLFFKDKVIRLNLIITILLNFVMLSGLYFQVSPRVEPVVLRYTIYFGIDLIGPWWNIFVFPLIGAVIGLLNFIIAYLIFIRIKLLSYFLVLSAALCQLLLIIMSILMALFNK